ncbi:hypothetical protein [Ruminococcus albus]|uniref:hypothetical protein n=1 Tax=Ruminococcus albus TaxID=1264 RepID=UPI0015A691A1|nr:hypothetical protein [Ruminococcus albus]
MIRTAEVLFTSIRYMSHGSFPAAAAFLYISRKPRKYGLATIVNAIVILRGQFSCERW